MSGCLNSQVRELEARLGLTSARLSIGRSRPSLTIGHVIHQSGVTTRLRSPWRARVCQLAGGFVVPLGRAPVRRSGLVTQAQDCHSRHEVRAMGIQALR
jgi:hypothetical protein